jgi:hypothetical protein
LDITQCNLVDKYQTTRCYIPDDNTLHGHRHERERKRSKKVGERSGEKNYISVGGRARNFSRVLKVPSQCPLALLAEARAWTSL